MALFPKLKVRKDIISHSDNIQIYEKYSNKKLVTSHHYPL